MPIAMAILLIPGAAMAQQGDTKNDTSTPADSAPAKPAAKPGEIAKVEVKGSAQDYDPRRDDTASKTVLTHEEIVKYGDTNVFDVLKRAPGVTVIGNSIRMRGLGSGYTQILVNGERPPPGFSMDALAPEQIEKIEVVRAATAEHSMQAIAGSINIVLTKVVAKPQRELRLTAGGAEHEHNLFALGTLADRKGRLSYFLNAVVSQNVDTRPSFGSDQFSTPDGQVTKLRESRRYTNNRSTMGGVMPRLNWKLANDDQLNLSAYLHAQHFGNRYASATTNLVGSFATPDYVDGNTSVEGRSHFAGGELNWVAKLGGGKFDAKLSLSKGRFSSDARSLSSTADHATNLERDTDSTSHFTNYGSTGKYSRTLFEDHSLAAGWEASQKKNEDDNLRVEGLVGTPPARIHEQFTPQVTQLAAYAQDEWNVTRNWSMYMGARWEGIRTDSAGSGLLATQSRTGVLSPVAQTLYKFPDKSGRQLRLALTRTFKAPDTNQLSARRFESDLNTRFSPDRSGNPNLRPELANGIDLTYEHFWAPGAVFSAGASARHIRDYIRSELRVDGNGHWLIQPLNDGSAQVRTLDVELKFPLKALRKDAPAFDFRASVNRNWSSVESVPGPGNRLDQQVPLSAVLGADYRADKFSAGASFAFRTGGPVRISEQQTSWMRVRRDLEAYLLYKISTGLQLRTSVNNALGEDERSASRYQDSLGTSQSWSRNPRSARVQANLEIKF
jgi:outer membrane receptor for ferrienterochelin and colicin